jgi:hypothetical protein
MPLVSPGSWIEPASTDCTATIPTAYRPSRAIRGMSKESIPQLAFVVDIRHDGVTHASTGAPQHCCRGNGPTRLLSFRAHLLAVLGNQI